MRVIYFLLAATFSVNAFHVDSMVKISDKEDYFLISGNADNKEYIHVSLSELIYDNEKSREVSYDATNVAMWPIVAEPSEIIISPGEKIKVRIAKNYMSSGNDRIFGITFNPDTLNPEGGGKHNVALGYKSWLLIPGSDQLTGTVSARKSNKPGDYIITNNTNKVMDVQVSVCSNKIKESCETQIISRPGTSKTVSFGESARNAQINFYTLAGGRNTVFKRMEL